MLDLRHKFKLVEVNEIMRQKGGTKFIERLNKIKVGNIDSYVDDILKTRFVKQPDILYPYDTLLIYAENDPANRYNECKLNSLPSKIYLYWVKMKFLRTAVWRMSYKHKTENNAALVVWLCCCK